MEYRGSFVLTDFTSYSQPLISSGPLVLTATLIHSHGSFTLSLFIIFFLVQHPNTPSLKPPHSSWPSEAVRRELPHLPTYLQIYPYCFSSLLLLWENNLCSYLRPTTPFLHYIPTPLGYSRYCSSISPLDLLHQWFSLSTGSFLPLYRHTVTACILKKKRILLLTPPDSISMASFFSSPS